MDNIDPRIKHRQQQEYFHANKEVCMLEVIQSSFEHMSDLHPSSCKQHMLEMARVMKETFAEWRGEKKSEYQDYTRHWERAYIHLKYFQENPRTEKQKQMEQLQAIIALVDAGVIKIPKIDIGA